MLFLCKTGVAVVMLLKMSKYYVESVFWFDFACGCVMVLFSKVDYHVESAVYCGFKREEKLMLAITLFE